ncbi:MAG: site-specific tyrosine recombinase XerD [Bacillota bacterium]|nr:site-specific tyrosine recombinase XerD [Bacillota bacterium]
MGAFEQGIEDYLDYISLEKGLSPATVDSYRRDLQLLAGFLSENNCSKWQDADADLLLFFFVWQKQTEKKPMTLSRRLSTYRGFSRYLLQSGQIKKDFCADQLSPRENREIPHVLSPAEIRILLEAPKDTPLGLRDRAMLEFAYGCGLRVSELLALTVHDIDPEEQLLRCWGKGRKERLVPVGIYALNALELYLRKGRGALLRGKNTQALFLNRLGDPLSRSGFWRILSAYGKSLGLEDLHPHSLRHSAATHMLDNGADLRLVQEFLGHSSIRTTQIYTRLSRSELKSHYLQHHPRYKLCGNDGAGDEINQLEQKISEQKKSE